MIQVELLSSEWKSFGATQVRGCAHYDDHLHSAAELAQLLDGCPTVAQWERTVAALNGAFAVVSRRGGTVVAAVDRIRSIPLFYRRGGTLGYLSDSAFPVADGEAHWHTSALVDAEFQLTGYVTGRDTLVTGLQQIQAGELLSWDAEVPGQTVRRQYYVFEHGDYFKSDSDDLIERLEMVHDRVFRRLVESTHGRQIAIPLSGGFDSRLIAVSLRDLGIRDVVCYTYGLPGNWEAKISQELARHLGFRWEFVPYSPERWRAWAASERFGQYFRAAGNLSSVPHIQDWPAVLELQREGRVAPDCIFVPGHSGDFLAGSHIPRPFVTPPMIQRKAFFDALYRAHYSLWDWPAAARQSLRDAFNQRIEAVIGRIGDCPAARAADLFERWDLQERQAKFICNSVRVYEHFGYEWRLPLFDHELMNFWARVPVAARYGRKLYLEFARRRQQLPVQAANTDRNVVLRGMLRGVELAGLKPMAKRASHAYRRLRWRDAYEHSSLGWMAVVDPEFFRRTFTGREIAHSYLARAYRDLWLAAPGKAQAIMPALGRSHPPVSEAIA